MDSILQTSSGGDGVIDCRQLLLDDSTVYSRQTLDFPGERGEGITPLFLLERYLALVRKFTFGIVRAARTSEGIDFRVAGLPVILISFTGPRMETGGPLTLVISGGLLVDRDHCDRGMLSFSVETVPGGRRVSLLLSGYCPMMLGVGRPSRVRKLLYRLTQAFIHRRVTQRFLEGLYRERYGSGACLRVFRSGPPEQRI